MPSTADRTVAAIQLEVPAYSGALTGRLGAGIRQGVKVSLDRFVELAGAGWSAADAGDPDAAGETAAPLGDAVGVARALGAAEARSGRSLEALLTAYRVGARVAWRDLADTAVAGGIAVAELSWLAETVFAFIDELSAASAAGHAREASVTSRDRERSREALAQALLDGTDVDQLRRRAVAAGWPTPTTVTPVLLPTDRALELRVRLGETTLAGEYGGFLARGLAVGGPAVGGAATPLAVLLVPDADRRTLLATVTAALRRSTGVLGPTVAWTAVPEAVRRAARSLDIAPAAPGLLDSDDYLTQLVVTADAAALADLRSRALAPLEHFRAGTRERLIETLRSWLLHQGRREAVAAALFVHPQTVRYRVQQLREAFGDALTDPETVAALVVALADPGAQVPARGEGTQHGL